MSAAGYQDKLVRAGISFVFSGLIAFALPNGVTSVLVNSIYVGQEAYEVPDDDDCVGVQCSVTHTAYRDVSAYRFHSEINSIFDGVLVASLLGIAAWVPLTLTAIKLTKTRLRDEFSYVALGVIIGCVICLGREFLRSEWRGGVWVGVILTSTIMTSILATFSLLRSGLTEEAD